MMNRLGKKRFVDRVFNAYFSWREACLHVSHAYTSWTSETGIGATLAYGAYVAALDREQSAAEAYGRLVRQAGRLVSGHASDASSHARDVMARAVSQS